MRDLETDVVEKPPVSIWKRLLIATAVVVGLLVVAGLLQQSVERSRSEQKLKDELAQLDESDPGWRLEELEASRPMLPDEENSAALLVEAHRLLPKGVPDNKLDERFEKLLQPELLDAERLALLERGLAPAAPALMKARSLASMPNGRHHIIHAANPLATLLPDVQKTRDIARLLDFDALCLAQQGDMKLALQSCRATLNAARTIEDEPFMISQLVRVACVAIGCFGIERTLALGEPSAEDLAGLQQLLEEEEKHPTLLVGLRGERATMHILFKGVSNGSLSLAPLVERDPYWHFQEQYMGWRVRSLARNEHPRLLELMGQAIDNAKLPTHEQADAEKDLNDEIKELSPANSLIRLLMPAMEKFAAATRRKLAFTRCLIVLLAVERHRQATGNWPAGLEELAPKLLPAVPLDPFDCKALRYRRLADGVVVYSIGPDGKDDGGMIGTGRAFGADVGYRLWDFKHRRQSSKPAKP